VTVSMAKQIDYSIWLEENKDLLNNILKDIFKSINNTDIPKKINITNNSRKMHRTNILVKKQIYGNNSL